MSGAIYRGPIGLPRDCSVPSSAWALARASRRSARRGGQILILTLLSMSLLVSLAFFAYNVGDKVNRRLEMQGAADSMAITGAGWMARNMNVVAMNNVGEAKMLSLVPILDTQPQASRLAYNEVKAWEQGLAAIVAQPVMDDQTTAQVQQYLHDGAESLRKRMADQRDILQPYQAAINPPFDMESITKWRKGAAPPTGQLWRAAVTMEDFSHAAVETCGNLAQKRGIQLAKADSATAAFLVPVKPEMPAKNGQYMDFQYPIRGYEKVFNEGAELGLTIPGTNPPQPGKGGAIPDMTYPHRLGPWARLHRWRDYESAFIQTGQVFVPGTEGAGETRGGSSIYGTGGRTVGRSARQRSDNGQPDHWQATGYNELNSYTTYGPYTWARRYIHYWARGTQLEPGKLRDTRYYEYLRDIGATKLEYLFGTGEAMPTKEMHAPNWIVGYPQCKAIGEVPENQVAFTKYYVVEIASKYPEQSGSFMTPGTFRTNGDYPIAWDSPGWVDVANPVGNNPRIPVKVADYVWKDIDMYESTKDDQLGIQEQRIPPGDPQGEVVWQPVYLYAWFIFGGIDIGGTEEVTNPCNWDQFDALPKPILLDTSAGDYGGDDPDVAWRREKFMFLGVARKSMEAPIWPQRFDDPNPIKGALTIAQAKLFNNKSFDLWTQDWRVSLAPVTRVAPASDTQSWVARLEAGITEAQSTDCVTSDEVQTAFDYLSALDSQVAPLYTFMSH
jgi:hypothetical protein